VSPTLSKMAAAAIAADMFREFERRRRLMHAPQAPRPQKKRRRSGRSLRKFWTQAELEVVRKLYAGRPTKEIARNIGRSVLSVYQAAAKLGLRKDEAYVRGPEGPGFQAGHRFGVATRFPKGHVPGNKGLRRPGWHAGRMKDTQFQKGRRSGAAARNWKPVGTVLPDSEGFLRIKVREAVCGKEPFGFGNVRVWPLLSRHTWEQHKGPIPQNHVIVYKDGDRSNCAIENLECVHRRVLAERNRMWNAYPRELAEAIQLNGVLKRKLKRLGGL
jgi:hypothetical protein